MDKEIIVGTTPGCTVRNIVKLLKSSESFSLLFDKWIGFAANLDTPQLSIKEWKSAVDHNKDSLAEVMTNILESWVGREASGAKLDDLQEALRISGMKVLSELLTNHFQSNQNSPPKKFQRIPINLQRFLNSRTTSNKKIGIVVTPDVDTTCSKIIDTTKDCTIFTSNQFLSAISDGDLPEGGHCYVVKEVSDDKLSYISEIHLNLNLIMIECILIIVNRDIEVLNEFLKSTLSQTCVQQIEVIADNMEWDDLSPNYKVEMLNKFLYITHLPIKIVKAEDLICGQTLVNLINNTKLFFNRNLSSQQVLPIERKILDRSIIRKESIFKECNQNCLFLFTNIDRIELNKLAGFQITDNSTSQLQLKSIKNIKYILLNDPSHFERICEKVKSPVSVHWVSHTINNYFQWVKSSCSLHSVEIVTNNKQPQISYASLLELITKDDYNCKNPVLISDYPETNTSSFLLYLRSHLNKDITEIVFLNDLINNLQFSYDEPIPNITEGFHKLFCTTELEKLIVSHRLTSTNIKINLLIDGREQISENNLQIVCKTIKCLITNNAIRIVLLTDFRILKKLESELGTLGYKLMPFTKENKIKYLSSFWSKNTSVCSDKLVKFAESLLSEFKITVTKNTNKIANLTLQFNLLAEHFKGFAIESCTQENAIPFFNRLHFNKCLTNMFEALILEKFEKVKTLNESYLSKDVFNLDEVHKVSVGVSYQQLFPGNRFPICLQYDVSNEMNIFIECSGLFKRTEFGIRLIDNSLAEYFIANFLIKQLLTVNNGTSSKQNTVKLLIKKGFKTEKFKTKLNLTFYKFSFPLICIFFDTLLNINVMTCANFNFKKILNFKTASAIAYACVNANLLNLFNFLDHNEGFEQWKTKIFTQKFLLYTMKKSGLDFVKKCLKYFELQPNKKFTLALKLKSLQVVVKVGNWSKVEFLLSDKKVRNSVIRKQKMNNLLHFCVRNTKKCSFDNLKQRTAITKTLFLLNPNLAEGKLTDGRTPLLQKNVHIELLVLLVELGVNVLQKDNFGNTILHRQEKNQSFTKEEYQILVNKIPKETFVELQKAKIK